MKIKNIGNDKNADELIEIINVHIIIINCGKKFCNTISMIFSIEICISMISVCVFGSTALLVNIN